MVKNALYQEILAIVASTSVGPGVGAGVITGKLTQSRPTVNRALVHLVEQGKLVRQGGGRSVVYRLASGFEQGDESPDLGTPVRVEGNQALAWSAKSQELQEHLSLSLGARAPVTYQRSFVDSYQPNISSLLPPELAKALYDRGKSKKNLPAGTYARKVLEQLLIDLSWSSSRLEGNKKSLLDTRDLFEKGHSGPMDFDTAMLLNHKDAIEFLVDVVPKEGMTVSVVRNLQSILMRDLLADSSDLGKIRNRIVHIEGTVYIPNQMPVFLEEMLELIVEKGRSINNPIESAFFFWLNLAYLQPFVDGNKRTSRLACNMPLLLANCAPMSFLNVEQSDYALAMLGVYERLDTSIAVDLFEHTYNRSIQTYAVVQDSMQAPSPLRIRYREQITDVVTQVVYFGATLQQAGVPDSVDAQDKTEFLAMVGTDLQQLELFNCARFRLPSGKTKEWIDKGRPF